MFERLEFDICHRIDLTRPLRTRGGRGRRAAATHSNRRRTPHDERHDDQHEGEQQQELAARGRHCSPVRK
jgi:hypothetical protein